MTRNIGQWWRTGVIYQVYPRSFQDADADGIGDLRGITARLPYLADLGIDAVWISPVFCSPMQDFGYDVSDYYDIDPIFGSLADFDALVKRAHELELRVVLDFVPNHSSDQHPWFAESCISKNSPKRDWYIWRDPAPGGGPPNNWLSEFGGSAWEFDPATGQYYYHAFLASQPDLNWRNPDVVSAMTDVLRFWMRRGVDGFRVDVMWHLLKDPDFTDNPINPAYTDGRPPHERLVPLYTTDHPDVHAIVRILRKTIDEFPDRLLIGEIYLPFDRLVAYYGTKLDGAHLPFNFTLLHTPWQPRAIGDLMARYEAVLPQGAWPNWVLGNHDRPRVASRVGREQAPLAAMLLLTLRGTPTIYYGDELGMPQVDIPANRVRDPFEKNVPGIGVGRDGARTPMQWSEDLFAGFSTVEPWLPLSDDWGEANVANLSGEPASILSLYRRLLAARRSHVALAEGDVDAIQASETTLSFRRKKAEEDIWIVLNFSENASVFVRDQFAGGTILVSTRGDRDNWTVDRQVQMTPHEGLVIACTKPGG